MPTSDPNPAPRAPEAPAARVVDLASRRGRDAVVEASVLWDLASHELGVADGATGAALLDRCSRLSEAGRHCEAIAIARAALAANPDLAGAHRVIAIGFGKLEERCQAVAAWLSYTAACPYDPASLREAARELAALGRPSLAADILAWSSAHQLEHERAEHERIVALVDAGRCVEAERAATVSLARAFDVDLHLLRARARIELQGGANGALDDLATYLVDRPFDLWARLLLAEVFEELGRAEQAQATRAAVLQQLDHELMFAITDAGLLAARALASLGLDRPEDAVVDASAATARAPTDPLGWYVLGRAHLATGARRRALAALRRAHELAPDRLDIAYDHCRALVICARADLAVPLLSRVVASSARLLRRAGADPLLRGLL